MSFTRLGVHCERVRMVNSTLRGFYHDCKHHGSQYVFSLHRGGPWGRLRGCPVEEGRCGLEWGGSEASDREHAAGPPNLESLKFRGCPRHPSHATRGGGYQRRSQEASACGQEPAADAKLGVGGDGSPPSERPWPLPLLGTAAAAANF